MKHVLSRSIPSLIRVRAGKDVLPRVRDTGITPRTIRLVAGSATGPRWCAFAGVDDAVAHGALPGSDDRKIILTGASAGAWRMAALSSSDPPGALRAFREAYIHMHFHANESPFDRRETLYRAVRSFLSPESVRLLPSHPQYELCFHTAQLGSFPGNPNAALSFAGFAAAMAANFISPRFQSLFWRGVAFETLESRLSPVRRLANWTSAPLTDKNIIHVLVASGAVPLKVAGVRNIPSAPRGVYCDGGLADYIWNREPFLYPGEAALLLHHGGPLYPTWLDKKAGRLKSRLRDLSRLITVSPGPELIATLPEGRLPDRQDWIRFAKAPEERIRRWKACIQISSILQDLFYELMDTPLETLVELLTGMERD